MTPQSWSWPPNYSKRDAELDRDLLASAQAALDAAGLNLSEVCLAFARYHSHLGRTVPEDALSEDDL